MRTGDYSEALTPSQRRRLARAIRGPLHRFDVSGETLYADLRAGGVEHEAALLLVAAFAREGDTALGEGDRAEQLRLRTDGGEIDA